MASLQMTYDEPAKRRPSTLDVMGLAVSAAAAVAIAVNALFLQQAPPRLLAPRVSETAASAASDRGSSAPRADDAMRVEEPVSVPDVAGAAKPSPLVKEVQAELARRGIYEGTADGLTGPKTAAAIRSFEIVAGLNPTGEASPKLLSILRQGQAGTAAPTAEGDPDVLQVQRMLAKMNIGAAKPDGVMGEATRSAIRRFEASRGIPPLGEITPSLKRQLSEAVRNAGR